MQATLPDIRPANFTLYRWSLPWGTAVAWRGQAQYLTDALAAFQAQGGSVGAIVSASFERLDVPGIQTFSDQALRDCIAWVENHQQEDSHA